MKNIKTETKKRSSGKRFLIFTLSFLLLFAAAVLAGYLVFEKEIFKTKTSAEGRPGATPGEAFVSPSYLKIYYPLQGHLQMEERIITGAATPEAAAAAAVREYLKGPAGMIYSYVPRGARLLGVYSGTDGILYVDLSAEFRRNFEGDALSEFLLLRGLYESVLSNLPACKDVSILIEGSEVDSIGGHLSADAPLGETVGFKDANSAGAPSITNSEGNTAGVGNIVK